MNWKSFNVHVGVSSLRRRHLKLFFSFSIKKKTDGTKANSLSLSTGGCDVGFHDQTKAFSLHCFRWAFLLFSSPYKYWSWQKKKKGTFQLTEWRVELPFVLSKRPNFSKQRNEWESVLIKALRVEQTKQKSSHLQITMKLSSLSPTAPSFYVFVLCEMASILLCVCVCACCNLCITFLCCTQHSSSTLISAISFVSPFVVG